MVVGIEANAGGLNLGASDLDTVETDCMSADDIQIAVTFVDAPGAYSRLWVLRSGNGKRGAGAPGGREITIEL
jgi:hypothetical protein